MEGISIVICCYNSARRLPETLRHAAGQQVRSDVAWEVIIVDNASKDDTVKVAEQCWKADNGPVSFRIVYEKAPGLSHARKRGILEARYSYILFCDDDNWLENTYVQGAFDRLKADSTIGIIGGCGIPQFEVPLPSWFEKYKKSYALGPQHQTSGLLPNHANIYGAGMVIRKDVLIRMYALGFESLIADRKGEALTSGGDTEICIWYKFWGYKLYYDGSLVFRHFIPQDRLTDKYYLKRAFEKGKIEAVFEIYRVIFLGDRVRWLEHKYWWYWELLKRLIHYGLTLFSPFSFSAKVQRQILLASFKFRIANFDYLKHISFQIKSGMKTYSNE